MISAALSAASESKAHDAGEHVHCVAKEMNLASRHIKPIDRVFDHRSPGFGKGDEKLNIEGKSLFVKPAFNGFVTFASHKLEAALGIVHRNACNRGNKGCEKTSSYMSNPGTLHRPTKDLTARAK